MDKLTTFDVWDTLLRRNCHPDLIKIFAWERFLISNNHYKRIMRPVELLSERQKLENEIALKSLRMGLDNEYSLDELYSYHGFPNPERQIDFEISLEILSCYGSGRINRHLKAARSGQLILISDFYMSGDQLRRIVSTVFGDLQQVPIITSADVGLNKRSGRLFRHLRIDQPWTHIGDNPHSDYIQSKANGAKPVLFRPKMEELTRQRRNREFHRRLENKKGIGSGIDSQMKIAIGLIGFCAWITTSTKGQIAFLEREGIFLKKFYEKFQVENPWDLNARGHQTLAVSRLSTVPAAFYRNPIGVMERLVRQYDDIDVPRLARTLGVSEKVFPNSFLKLGGIELVSEVSRDSDLMANLREITQISYDNALNYLRSAGLSEKVLCVDLGWSGTIQANLRDILGKNVELQGRYFMMRPTSVNFPEKLGFLNHHSELNDFYRVLRALRPIEMLFNSRIGSTISYKRNGLEVEVERSQKLDSFPESFQSEQDDILNLYEEASSYIRQNLLTLQECSLLGIQGLSDFVSKPRNSLVRDYLNSFHDESYGLGVEVHPGKAKFRVRDLAFVFRGDSKPLKKIYWQVGWPEALAKSSLGFIPGKNIMRLASKFIWKRG